MPPLPPSPPAAAPDLAILVFGHRRARSLRLVLEGLRRQGALANTQVWLDGHQEYAELVAKVEACRALEADFPEAKWVKYGARSGLAKLMIAALDKASQSHRRILVLEDDCFPAEDAVAVFQAELDAVEADDSVFSVYGHHFGTPDEGEHSTAFQCWGWATTAEKVRPVVAELRRLWNLAEPDCVAWIQERMTPEIRERMDVHQDKSSSRLLSWRFCWDATVAFLAARAGQTHKRTPRQVVFNFGVGVDSGHFGGLAPRFFLPPFNMISEVELRRRFHFPVSEEEDPTQVELGKILRFGAESADRRLLGKGWSIPEGWGTWSEGDESFLHLRTPEGGEGEVLRLVFGLRAFTGGRPPELAVSVSVNGQDVAAWTFGVRDWDVGREVEVPATVWRAQSPAEIRFRYVGARSPAEVSDGSPDTRRLALGMRTLTVDGRPVSGA